MSVDIERLKIDQEYWDREAPTGATHVGLLTRKFYRWAYGVWWRWEYVSFVSKEGWKRSTPVSKLLMLERPSGGETKMRKTLRIIAEHYNEWPKVSGEPARYVVLDERPSSQCHTFHLNSGTAYGESFCKAQWKVARKALGLPVDEECVMEIKASPTWLDIGEIVHEMSAAIISFGEAETATQARQANITLLRLYEKLKK